MSVAAIALSPESRPYRLITKRELRMLVPYCDQHILRLEKAGKFPKRIQIGDNRVGWYEHEIIEWICSRPRRQYPVTDDDSGIGEIQGRGRAIVCELEDFDNERSATLYVAGLKQASGVSKAGPVLSPELRRYRIIGKRELRMLVPNCDQHILRLEKAWRFPRRLDLGDNRVGWFEREVIDWIRSRPRRQYPATDDDCT